MTALRLLKAARAGDEAEIEALIARGVKGTRKQLIEAARAGEADVVDVLLRSGTRGTRPQLEAAREAEEDAVEKALLRSGAAGAGGRLLLAYQRDDSAEIEALRREGALSQAALQRELERALLHDEPLIAAALLRAGANPNAEHSKGGRPVFQSAHTPEVLGVLIAEGVELNAPPPADGIHRPIAVWLADSAARGLPTDHAPALAMLKLALAAGTDPNARDHNGHTALEELAFYAAFHDAPHADTERLTPERRRWLIAAIETLIEAGAERGGALARYRREVKTFGGADPAIAAALGGDAARMDADFEAKRARRAADRAANPAMFEAEKRAHPPPDPAPAKQAGPDAGAWIIAAIIGAALLIALVTCGARPAPAGESDPPGWRYMETIDGDTLAFAVPALPAPLARVLVRLRGVDTPERRRPKCEWERRAGEAATAIVLTDLKWGKYGGRVLARAPVDGVDLAEAIVRAGHGRAYDGARRARGAAA